MEKIFKPSRTHLPFYWWFLLPPVIFMVSMFVTSIIFFLLQLELQDSTIAYTLILTFFILYIIFTVVAKIMLKKRSYLSITDDKNLSYHSFTGKRWEILISDIEAIDDKSGEYRKSASAVGSQAYIRTEFVIKAKGEFYNSYISLIDWQDFLHELKVLNPGLVVKSLATDYSLDFANKTVISDSKLYSSGNKILKYTYWGLGIVLVIFCFWVMFALRFT